MRGCTIFLLILFIEYDTIEDVRGVWLPRTAKQLRSFTT